MRSGHFARLTRVSTDTLRHYERLGLLPAPRRTPSNYRDYAPSAEGRVTLIQRALRVGFSLPELKAILAVRDKGGLPCRRVHRLLHEKLRAMDEQIAALLAWRTDVKKLLRGWDQRLARTPAGHAARLLEALPAAWDGHSARHRSAPKHKKGKNS